MNPRFVYWYLHSPAAQDYFNQNQKGVAVRGINVGDVRPMEIPIPPEAEQARIVTLVEHAFAWLDKIAAEHARAAHLLPKLDQAILAKAFRGDLVPQDPNDEPASALLERIKAERGAEPARRRGVRG
jgi:type I restriction enzyme S subunit